MVRRGERSHVPLTTDPPQQTTSLLDQVVGETHRKERPSRGGPSEIGTSVLVRQLRCRPSDRLKGYSAHFAGRISKMQKAIKREAAGSLRVEQQKTANDRNVFRKI